MLSLLGVLVVAAVVLVLVLANTPWGNERVRRFAVRQANARLTGTLSIDTLRGGLFSHATLTNLRLVDSAGQPVIIARHVRVRYSLLPALRGHLVIKSLELDTVAVLMDKQPGGRWNFLTLLRPSTTPKDSATHAAPPELANIVIHDGSITYRRPWHPDTSLAPKAQQAVIAAALSPTARLRTVRVPSGFQRVLEYRRINASLPVVQLAVHSAPTTVQIAALSMLAEPYRPPAIDIRSLTGTLLVGHDSLWWHGARMTLPASTVSGDGRIGFAKSGVALDLTGAPVTLSDLRWLSPGLPKDGGGHLHLVIRLHGDTSAFAISEADVRYGAASLRGRAAVSLIKHKLGHREMLLRGADITVAQLSTAIIHELAPGVALPRSGTLNGHVAASGTPAALQVDADLRFADTRAGESHVIAHGGVATQGGLRANDLRVRLLPLRVETVTGKGVSAPFGGTVSGTATLNGSVASGFSVRGDLTHVQAGNRSRVIGSGSYRVAGKRIVADAALQPLSLTAIGRLVPSAELRGDVTGKLHAEGTPRDMRISGSLRSANGGGAVQGRVAFATLGDRTRYDVAVELDALNARAFSRRAPATSLSGTVAARGSGTQPATANAFFSADLVRSRYDTFSVDRLRARVAAVNGLLRVDTIFVSADGARGGASGTLALVRGRSDTLQFAATVDSLGALRRWLGSSDTATVAPSEARQAALVASARADSSRRAIASRIERLALGLPAGEALVVDTLPGIRQDSLSGSLAVRGTIHGSVPAPGVDATIEGRKLVARGSAVERLSATVHSPDLRANNRSIVFRAEADEVQISGRGYGTVMADGSYRDHTLAGSIRVRQDSLIAYAALGSWTQSPNGVHVVQLDSLRAVFDTLVWRLAAPASVRLANGNVSIDSVDLRSSAGGRLFANGSVPKRGAISLAVAVENVRVATVLEALQKNPAGDGVLAANAVFTGTRAAPVVTGGVTLRDARYGDTRAPDVDVELRYALQRLALDATARDSVGRRVLSGTASLPLDLALGSVEGSRRVAGPLVGRVVLDSLSLAGLPLASRGVQEISGFVRGNANLGGTWKAPAYSGDVALRDGGVLVVSTGMRVTNAIADLALTRDTLRLDSLVAQIGGPLRAHGYVDLTRLSHPTVNLAATGTNLRVLDARRGLVDVDGDIMATGPLSAIRVTGHGEMLHGFLALKQFNKKLLRVKAPGSLTFFAVYDTTPRARDSALVAAKLTEKRTIGIIADLSMTVDHGSYYRNRPDANTQFFTGEGEAVLAHLDTRTSDAWAVGVVRISGGVAIFRAAPFEPARGSLTLLPWNNSAGILEQVGERPVWEPGRGYFPVELLTGGTSKAPSLGLESGTLFPMRGRELNSYLTIGRDRLSLLQQSGSSLSGSEAWSGQLSGETGALARRQQAATALGVMLHDIGTGATKEFGLDALSVSPADVPTELVFGKTGGVRGAMFEGGRYFTTERYVAAQMRLTTGIPGLRVEQKFGTTYQLDVGIEPRFLFGSPAELGITHPTVRTGMFGAFLTRFWEW